MTITVTNLGSVAQGNIAGSATQVITTVAAVPAGALICVLIQDRPGVTTPPSITDSAGNAYVLAQQQIRGTATSIGYGEIFYAKNTIALPSGGTITITRASANSVFVASAFYATGLDATNPLDAAVTAGTFAPGSSSSTPSITSGAPSVAGELFVALLTPNGAVAYTEDTADGWTNTPPNVARSGTTTGDGAVNGAVQINAGTSPITYTPTISASTAWSIGVVAFKPFTGSFQHLAASAQAFATGTAALDLQHHVAAAMAAVAASAALLRDQKHLAAALGALASAGAILDVHKDLGASLADIATGTGSLDVQKHLAAAAAAIAAATIALEDNAPANQKHMLALAAAVAQAQASLDVVKHLAAAGAAQAALSPGLRKSAHLGAIVAADATGAADLYAARVARPDPPAVANVETTWRSIVNRADPSQAEANRREVEYAFSRPGRKFYGDGARRGAYN